MHFTLLHFFLIIFFLIVSKSAPDQFEFLNILETMTTQSLINDITWPYRSTKQRRQKVRSTDQVCCSKCIQLGFFRVTDTWHGCNEVHVLYINHVIIESIFLICSLFGTRFRCLHCKSGRCARGFDQRTSRMTARFSRTHVSKRQREELDSMDTRERDTRHACAANGEEDTLLNFLLSDHFYESVASAKVTTAFLVNTLTCVQNFDRKEVEIVARLWELIFYSICRKKKRFFPTRLLLYLLPKINHFRLSKAF